MKIKHLYAIAFTLLVQITHAQTFGIKGGVNFANITISGTGTDILTKSVTGFHFGPVADFKLQKNLHLNTGLQYSLKGYTIGLGGEHTIYKLNYLEIPLNLAYNFSLSKKSFIFLQAGPYLGYAIGGKTKFVNEIEDITIGEDGIKRYDFGLGFGAGLEFRSIVTSLNYQPGLANVNGDSADEVKLQHKVFQISVAYMFGNKE
jgi:hypothetical protein